MAEKEKVSFKVFFLMWAKQQGWTVPDIHIAICHWMEFCDARIRVLRVFRGCGKSTILGVFNAWKYYKDPEYQILHQGADDNTAYKTARDTQNILQKHPLTRNIGATIRGNISFWWTADGYWHDPRNPSMQAAGITSNITSSRANYAQNDDVEVQKNVATPEAREKVRDRLDEQVHIVYPGSTRDFIGTPHTHDSLYDQMIELGAEHLTIPLYGKEQRFDEETASRTRFNCPFIPEIVFVGIGKHSRVAEEGKDYHMEGHTVVFGQPPGGVVDCYADSAWPERFDIEEMTERRRQCATLNKWDSQYQLHAKPVTDVRLDPDKIIPYEIEPEIRMANRRIGMWLGNVNIVGASAYWDCALGKVNNDPSTFSVVLTDDLGRLYWQLCEALTGNVDEQCKAIRDYVIKYQLPRVNVETNGVGGFVPPILRKHLAKTGCGVGEVTRSTNKNAYILDALEAPIDSGFLWAHVDVLNGPLWDEMKEWNPKVKDQPDSYMDSGAGAVTETPVRIGKLVGNPSSPRHDNWRPNQGTFNVKTDYDCSR